MTPFRVQAPGKIVVLGEYAVLDGVPAVVAAVDRGVACEVLPAHERRIETPTDDRFVGPALADAPPALYRFTDWNPVDLPSKPGLGGSAAAVVSAVVAGAHAAGRPLTPDQVQERAFAIHHAVQGSGSGIDVAASTHGGVLRFQSGEVEPLPAVEPVVVWSGQSAATGPRVQQYLAWTDRSAFVRASEQAVHTFATDPVEALRLATEALDRMSRLAGVAYWTEALRGIRDLADRHGGAAKPSGAGGGDVAVALFTNPDARSRFVSACTAAGWPVIPTRLAAGCAVVTVEEP